MSSGKPVQYIDVPNLLAVKASTKKRADTERMFAEAEAELAEMNDSYRDWAEADIEGLRAALAEVRAAGADCKSQLKKLFDIVHNMKGQGTMFGYPLVTETGELLCRFLDDLETADETVCTIIEHHVDTLAAVIRGRITGDGGEVGQDLIASLHTAVAKLGG